VQDDDKQWGLFCVCTHETKEACESKGWGTWYNEAWLDVRAWTFEGLINENWFS